MISTPRHSIVKLLKAKYKEKILTASKGRRKTLYAREYTLTSHQKQRKLQDNGSLM